MVDLFDVSDVKREVCAIIHSLFLKMWHRHRIKRNLYKPAFCNNIGNQYQCAVIKQAIQQVRVLALPRIISLMASFALYLVYPVDSQPWLEREIGSSWGA
jgi:hypothetical protein